MDKSNLTRDEAIKLVGLAAVEAAEANNCEPTGRIGGNGIMHDDPYIEYEGSTDVDYDILTPEQVYNLSIGGCRLVAVYQETNEQEQRARAVATCTWDINDIVIDHYRID